MHYLTITAAAALTPLLFAACDAPSAPADHPARSIADSRASLAQGGHEIRLVNIMDACDAESFAAVGCLRNGGVNFDRFLELLGKHGIMSAWHFAPPVVHAKVGQALLAVNRGGEVHTFTEVEEFGGGIVPLLNQLSGNPVPAPECLGLEADDFVPPGGTYSDEVEEAGTEIYQCCIHPWMRARVVAAP